jgi:hypothetical protein
MKREVLKHLFPKKICMNLEILLPNFSLIHMPTLNLYIKNIPAPKSTSYDQNHLEISRSLSMQSEGYRCWLPPSRLIAAGADGYIVVQWGRRYHKTSFGVVNNEIPHSKADNSIQDDTLRWAPIVVVFSRHQPATGDETSEVCCVGEFGNMIGTMMYPGLGPRDEVKL